MARTLNTKELAAQMVLDGVMRLITLGKNEDIPHLHELHSHVLKEWDEELGPPAAKILEIIMEEIGKQEAKYERLRNQNC